MRSQSTVSVVLAVGVLVGCKVYDPLFCDAEKPCTDPERPFCDLEGAYPESDGVARTCIRMPTVAADGGVEMEDASQPIDGQVERRIIQVAVGSLHTCVVLNDGALRCWGEGHGLGYSSLENVGDDEHPYQVGDVPTGGRVKQVAVGDASTCALYETGNVRCWGANYAGQLGYGDRENRQGAGETPDVLPDVQLGEKATQIQMGASHACALLESGSVRCWGSNYFYELANGETENIGDNEVPGSRSPVQLGDAAVHISAGAAHTCAVMEGGFVRCWGTLFHPYGPGGPLGYGGTEPIGDDETPESAGNIVIGGSATQVAAGFDHNCALLVEGRVRCWGNGDLASTNECHTSLGYPGRGAIGDDESPASAGDVMVGGEVVEIGTMQSARCARLANGSVRCWGTPNIYSLDSCTSVGMLGYGNNEVIGDDETPASAGDVQLGAKAVHLSRGVGSHICALLEDGALRCWGRNSNGELGLGHTETVGDDEVPTAVDAVRVLK